MKTIKIESGRHTIEVKRGSKGQILIRHSRIDPKKFGEFHEAAELEKKLHGREIVENQRIDPERLGGYVRFPEELVHNQTVLIDAQDVHLVREAIKQLE
jgi:hypothetical protein